ncbi:FAD dependent oxidoreductase [Sedimentisphaera cyanobacteriorum]|uniref:FAD dependent oxidoreductase n=1 Tax=Sedimentisphaera cyanobacteriorum TaxID=1940790 RepID=A0A1Q2HSM1_9BACT|nr:FAD-dependent oxidoreductase [Sedimentisphaera cyanobacteriorum]AQQ10264.1 FAD dependent oxidoreductase [Sedimentisphaera cyanobacteriorum]
MKAKVFIDCTGDGDISARAGAEYDSGDKNGNLMPATLCSQWSGVNWDLADPVNMQLISEKLEKAFKDNVFSEPDRHHTGMAQTGRTLASANMGHIYDIDNTNEESVTRALIKGREMLPEFEHFYQEYVPGYENIELCSSASLLGIRESRRIRGDYQLNISDYLERRKFNDQIGCYAYEIDIHPSSSSREDYEKAIQTFKDNRYKTGEHYGIPYRALTVKGFSNLLAAGRSISTDREMQGSIRTMPGCFITGQAAGMAASLASRSKTATRKIDIKELQAKLADIGAFIGELPNE